MSYSNEDNYGLCKNCFKQQKFCECTKKQSFSENHPLTQSIGEQEQKQQQEQGGLEQQQGPQLQGQNQEGQSQGPQSQEQQQGPQSQGSLSQNQNESQEQVQVQDQTEDQDQTQGNQTQSQRHGDQTMENNQTIDTPIDIDGVTVDVKCGDCKPIIIFNEKIFKSNKKFYKHRGGDVNPCNHNRCKNVCKDCCVQELGILLKQVQKFQTTITSPTEKAINIYFSSVSGFPSNPTTDGQVITEVIECETLRYKLANQLTPVPSRVVQLCDVAGITAQNTGVTPSVYTFLLEQATTQEDDMNKDQCKKKKTSCKCSACANGIGKQLESAINFGIEIQLYLKGQISPFTPLLYVLSVKDGIAYFIDDLINPQNIYVFSLCAISGYFIDTQTIG